MAGIIEAPRNMGYVRSTIRDRAERFPKDFVSEGLRVTDQKTIQLIDDLQSGRFWGVLSQIDGSNNPLQPDESEIKEEKRAWARKMFSPDELDSIARLAIDTAITAPFRTPWPGTTAGHGFLYYALVAENPGSMFEGRIAESLRRQIVNGAFWETIPKITPIVARSLGIGRMETILRDNLSELDVQFATEGYELFRRNGGEQNAPALIYMTEGKFSEYTRFIGRVDNEHQALGLTDEQMGYLTEPITRLGSREDRREERRMLREVGSL